jgi:hypothetical protein
LSSALILWVSASLMVTTVFPLGDSKFLEK